MSDWFIWMCFGAAFGDYLFQNQWMAFNKKDTSLKGFTACLVHCSIYTTFVCVFIWFSGYEGMHIDHIALVFLSHWVLDRYHLVEWWTTLYKVRSWNSNLPMKYPMLSFRVLMEDIEWGDTMTTKQIVQTVFGAFVYIIIDNTLHLFMMFLVFSYV